MTGHLDADTLAEYREGLLGRRRSARIRAHLAGCSQCSAADRDLAEVSTLLAAAPAPRMPDDLASRLQGVLATEAATRAAAPAPAQAQAQAQAQQDQHAADPDGHRRARTTRTPRQRRALTLRVASATAVVAVLAAVGIDLAHNSGGVSNGGTGASSGAAAAVPAHGSTARAAGPDMAPNSTSGGSSFSLAGGIVPVLHSGRNYQAASLATQAQAELGSYMARANSQPRSISGGTSQSVSTLQGCVRRTTGGARPTLVDQARYQGQPAAVIVQAPAATRAGQVWVTGAGCSATHPDLLAHAALAATG
ncbi:MAG TPA: hypothetical protein VGH27_14890 [Streptosporangiaceae bacterium]|jgi:hypothetical protein